MALETLKGINEIGGFKVIRSFSDAGLAEGDFKGLDEKRKEFPINITERLNCISFKFQDGPIKENGVNGAQIDVLAHVLKLIVEGLNKDFPSEFNDRAIKGLDDCLQAFADRKADREKRNVEGMNLK